MFENVFGKKPTNIFPEGVGKIGDEDGIEKRKKEELAKKEAGEKFLKELHKFLLYFKRHGFVVPSNDPDTVVTKYSFYPEELADFSRKNVGGDIVLSVDDILEIMEVSEKDLEKQNPKPVHSNDRDYEIYVYKTKEPILDYIRQERITDPKETSFYFHYSEEELKEFEVPNVNSVVNKNMEDAVDSVGSPKHPDFNELTPEIMDFFKKQIDDKL